MTMKKSKNAPEYHEKIYEFDSEALETEMKDFLFKNQNLQCLVRINQNIIPDDGDG